MIGHCRKGHDVHVVLIKRAGRKPVCHHALIGSSGNQRPMLATIGGTEEPIVGRQHQHMVGQRDQRMDVIGCSTKDIYIQPVAAIACSLPPTYYIP